MAARLKMALAAFLLAGCRDSPPQPKKVSEIEPTIEPKERPRRQGPFRDPNADPPGPRTEAQLPTQDLEATIARGHDLIAQGREAEAIQVLRNCANRVPQSIECEAELGLTMFTSKQQLADARYYLSEAANAQPARAKDALYRRLGTMALSKAQYATAAAALGVLLARETATADDLEALAHALQADANKTDEAADVYARAYVLAPDRHELVRKRATLLAQAGEHARAATLFEAYLDKAKPDEKQRVGLERRIALLRARAATSAK